MYLQLMQLPTRITIALMFIIITLTLSARCGVYNTHENTFLYMTESETTSE